MKKRILRIISLALVLVITLQTTGMWEVVAYATEASDETVSETVAETASEPEIIGEDFSKRKESVKHFRMSDGSFMAVSYGVPVHYQDESGNWQDINNIPVMTADVSGTETYQISNAESSVSFASTLEDGNLLTISYEDKAVQMSLLDTSEVWEMTGEMQTSMMSEAIPAIVYNRDAAAQLEANNVETFSVTAAQAYDEAIMPAALSSSVIYEDVYPGIDIRYTTWSYTVKEEIIVKAVQDSYRYDFFLRLNGLEAVVNTDGSISMVDSDETEIFRIPAPYMIDAAGAFSDLVNYTITEMDDGIVLTVEPDESWIESEERVFPISIDPTVNTSPHDPYNSEADEIYSTYVHPSYQTSSLYTSTQRYTGFGGSNTSSPYIVYMYFNNIPEVPVGCFVSDANVKIYYSTYSNGGCSVMPIGLFSVTDSIPDNETPHSWFKKIAYSNKPKYDTSNVIDFVNTSASNTQRFVSLDITELAKGWYSGENNRTVALAPIGTYSSSYYAWQYYVMSEAYYCPVMTVTYRSNYGLEDYYTYQSMSAGEAGTAYIADSTGQLKVVKNLFSDNSAANPFSLNLVYNSDYFVNSSSDYLPPSEMGLNISIGSGWTLDCIQTTAEEMIGTEYYIKHRDGDGTIHYYKYPYNTATSLYDEDGLGLSMTQSGMDWNRIYDHLDNYLMFNDGILTELVDWNENAVYINYTNKRITSITRKNVGQTEVTLATFVYSGNTLTSITDAAGNTYTLGYTSGKLTSIKKNNTTVAQFSYSGYRVTKMLDSESSYALNFTYNTNGLISGYSETGGTKSGAAVSVSYPGQNQITYRDPGPDYVAGNKDDLLHHYLFDYAGRTINAYVTSESSTSLDIYGASNCAYSGSNSTDRTTNRILRSASTGVVAQQLLRNTSLESGNWTHSGTSVSTENPRTGAKSIKGTTTSSSTMQYAQRSSESLQAKKTYTFSCYVNTEGMTFTGKGIYLKVTDANGSSWSGDPIAYATNDSVDSGWVRISVTFTAKTSGAHTVAVCREKANGTFYADDFQLEAGEAPSAYNMVENGAMSSNSAWTMGSGAAISSDVLTITGNPTGTDTAAYQDITVNASGSRTYVLSGWVKTNGVPDTVTTAADPAQDTNKQCGLRAILTYSDGTKEYHYVPFNTEVKAWQFVSYAIIPKSPAKTVSTIRVVCAYEGNVETTSFDNISLIQEVAQSMSYNTNGLLETVSTTGLGADTDTYSGARLLLKRETAGYGTYIYNYLDSANSCRVSSVTNGYVTESYSYSGVGNLTTTTISGSSNMKIVTSNGYSADGNQLTSVTDAAGSKVTYAYGNANSKMLGLSTSVTAPNGAVTNTTYDAYNRVAKTSVANAATLEYNYSNGYLSTITRKDNSGNTQTYTITSDKFGNATSIKVGQRTLASYEYQANNGYLTKQTDGNSSTVSYDYDHLGRVKTATYSDGLMLTYAYTGEGYLYSVTATEDGNTTKYIYSYDTNGRLISSERKDNDNSVMRTRQGYDEVSRLVGQIWELGSDTYSESFTYDSTIDGSLATHKTATGQTLTMGYDKLRRLSTVTGESYKKTYAYRDISGTTQTTSQIESLTYDLPTAQIYEYTYDNMGNIATYTDANGTVTYTYDKQGQLTKAAGTTTYNYTYDTVGNILTGNGHTYTYGDDKGWEDLLTAVDGQPITYDAIGNPTSYYNGTRWNFTWKQGRELSTATSNSDTGDVSISYTYNPDGLRTGKTVVSRTYHKHSYSKTIVAPTCTESGYTIFECNCGYSYQGATTAALGHAYTETVVAPTCTEPGYTIFECDCGYSYQGEETAALGHNYTSEVIPPTETEPGYTLYTCALCGNTYQDAETPATGHIYTETVVAPTCTEPGYTIFECECGYSYQDEETPATGHTYTENVVAPTCTEPGYTIFECDCGYSYQGAHTAPLGHSYTTEMVSGCIRYTCSGCGDTYLEVTEEHTHSYSGTVVEPTCTERGYTLYECMCGDSYQDNYVSALGHKYVMLKCIRCGERVGNDGTIPVPTLPPIGGEIMSTDDRETVDSASTNEVEAASEEEPVIESAVTQTYDYFYLGSKLGRMTVITTVDDGAPVSETIDFFYDASGYPYALKYKGTTYYYITNLQGDVMQIVNASGSVVAAYNYDPYGNVISATGTLAEINPLRYRGYVFDTETGLYYVSSRYYDPEIGRFINADSLVSTGQGLLGNNMFAYCNNNPVNNIDPTGMWTVSFSVGGDFTFFFFGASISIGIAFDDDANVAIQWSYSAPNYLNDDQTYYVGLFDAGVGGSLQLTDDDTIYDLEGPGSYAGFTAGNGLYGGVDMVYSGVEAMDERTSDALPNGIQVSFGYGIGVDAHFRQTQTRTLLVIN